MITTLGYYNDIAITTTSSGIRSYNRYILSVSRNEIRGTYDPIILLPLCFIDFVIFNRMNLF